VFAFSPEEKQAEQIQEILDEISENKDEWLSPEEMMEYGWPKMKWGD